MASYNHSKTKTDSSAYQEQDNAHFSAFNDQIKLKQTNTPNEEGKTDPVETSSFCCSKTDAQQFEKLLPSLPKSRSSGKSDHQNNTPSSSDRRYSDTDRAQFKTLMAFGSHPVQTGHQDNNTGASAERSFRYNEKDLQAFGKISPVTQSTDPSTANKNSELPTVPDRDVGHIRIKEFDGETASQRKQHRRQNPNIKVQFFD